MTKIHKLFKKVLALLRDLAKVPLLRALFPFIIGILLGMLVYLHDIQSLKRILLLNYILIFFLLVLEIYFDYKSSTICLLRILSIIILFVSCGYMLTGRAKLGNLLVADLDGRHMILAGELLSGIEEVESSLAISVDCLPGLLHDDPEVSPGKIRIYLNKNMDASSWLPGDILIFSGKLNAIRNRGNPDEFDYKSYMQRKGFHYFMFLGETENLRSVQCDIYRFRYAPLRFRQRIISRWDRSDRGVAILSALTMGDKSLLDQESKADFSRAGAMHLLAVSGLHVGMVWWVLNLIIRVPRNRFWNMLKVALVIIILWFYAGVTGFSESVSRSVCMFTILSISNALNRRSIIYNSLFLSAFILLVFNPYRIQEAGFLLSYMAVFGIVSVQPLLANLYAGFPAFIRRVFDLLSVSIAAQMFTLPLTLHLFQQFPLYFLLTNLLAIPLVSIILGTFIITLPFLIIEVSSDLVFKLLYHMVSWLDLVVTKIADLPGANIQGISVNTAEALLILFGILSFVALLYYRKAIFLVLILSAVTGLILYSSGNDFHANQVDKFCLYNHRDSIRQSYLSGLPLSSGMHTLQAANADILFLGECELDKMMCAIDHHSWDVLVFTPGFPYPSVHEGHIRYSGTVIADPGLSALELWYLKRAFQEIYLLRDRGAYIIWSDDWL